MVWVIGDVMENVSCFFFFKKKKENKGEKKGGEGGVFELDLFKTPEKIYDRVGVFMV